MIKLSLLLYLYAFSRALLVLGLRFDPELVNYNLNQNKQAVNPLDYTGIWQNHRFNPSPENWRFPFYSFFLDKFANGDPSNDDINGTQFEHDPLSVTSTPHFTNLPTRLA
jgi:alpha-1,3-glucan synthase